jgi:hypothetical protein
MEEKINRGDAIDLSQCERTKEGYYILDDFIEDKDYCDKEKEYWIWTIGINYKTGRIHASTTAVFYQNLNYECLWLR